MIPIKRDIITFLLYFFRSTKAPYSLFLALKIMSSKSDMISFSVSNPDHEKLFSDK